jgi:hypothetical protein
MKMALSTLVDALNGLPVTYKLNIKGQPPAQEWSKWIIAPSPSYIEVEVQGPYSIRDIESIEINAEELKFQDKDHAGSGTKLPETIMMILSNTNIEYVIGSGLLKIYLRELGGQR